MSTTAEQNSIYPWLQQQWQLLLKRAHSNFLPHALLFSGIPGLGKLEFAQQFAHSLLCASPNPTTGTACGECSSCKLIQSHTHPDLSNIFPEELGKAIPIDAIRQVSHFFSLTSQYGRKQIVVLSPAENMNQFAANSLLKTLEEPTPNSLLILVSHQPHRLLATIRSRCQSVNFKLPDIEISNNWLKDQAHRLQIEATQAQLNQVLWLNSGAPVAALQSLQDQGLSTYLDIAAQLEAISRQQIDPLKVASQWQKKPLSEIVKYLSILIMALIQLKSTAQATDSKSSNAPGLAKGIAKNVDTRTLFTYLDKLFEYRRMSQSTINAQLAMEDLLISWSQLSH